jgi:hypothetical protein
MPLRQNRESVNRYLSPPNAQDTTELYRQRFETSGVKSRELADLSQVASKLADRTDQVIAPDFRTL